MLPFDIRRCRQTLFQKGSVTAMIRSMTSADAPVGRRDIAIAAVFSALGLLLMYGNVVDKAVEASVLAIPLFLLITVPLAWRRAAPVAALAAVLGGYLVHVGATGTEIIRCGVVLPIVFLLAFAAGARLQRRDAQIALALALIIIAAESIVFFGAFGVVMAAVTGAIWGTGRVVRSRARLAEELQARTVELRDARDERARMEVSADRVRLSGQLDELLQRRLGELAQLADNGSQQADAATATATLVDIEQQSRQTLEEMRAVVDVLRHDEAGAPTAPQPTLVHLEALLVRAKGSDARLTVEGRPRVLPAGVELSAYRILEHLLDALEDAPDVDLRVRFGDDALELAVRGPARRRGHAGAAIERARERVQLHHGTLQAHTRGGQAEAVAHLPVLAGA